MHIMNDKNVLQIPDDAGHAYISQGKVQRIKKPAVVLTQIACIHPQSDTKDHV